MSSFDTGRVPVAFRTLGCKVNRVESDEIAADLLGRGVTLADEDEAAVIVINTCTVTAEADSKARKAVRHALKAASSPIVVVTGCLAALDASGLRALGERVIVEADKAAVADLVAEKLVLAAPGAESHVPVGEGFRSRAMLKVEDGCDNFCSYCIVPYARGVPRAVPLAEVAAQARRLVGSGAREIVLTGINIGRYDDGEADLADVVARVAATGVERLRLSSIEPQHLTERLLAALASTAAVCEHLHVPLQSGSDAVLSRMKRGYTTDEYRSCIENARAAIDGLAITTDVIAGFPGETDDDHAQTLAFIETLGFSKLHVFRYSVRPGTPAAQMLQTPAPLRARRAAELRVLGDRMRSGYLDARAGRRAQVLVEAVHADHATGTTRDYLRLRVEGNGFRVGELIGVTLAPGMVAT